MCLDEAAWHVGISGIVLWVTEYLVIISFVVFISSNENIKNRRPHPLKEEI